MIQNWNNVIEPLYKNEFHRLYTVAYRKTKNQELAKDLVQDTFLLAIFNPKKLMEHPKPAAWLMQALNNLLQNEMRTLSHKTIPLDEAVETPASTENTSIYQLLPAQLSDRDREILIWRFEQQMGYHEMSMRLGISEALCRKWVSQAVNRCREVLRE